MQIQHGHEVRDATSDEIAAYESSLVSAAKSLQDAQDIADARASAMAKLAALGLTDAEIRALVG